MDAFIDHMYFEPLKIKSNRFLHAVILQQTHNAACL